MADGIRDKLIAIKQAWAESRRLLTGKADPDHANRLPPGQRLVTNWPVLDLGVKPDIAKSEWRLKIDGAVEHPQTWDWESYQAQPQMSDISDIHCVTQWSRFDNRWDGVATKHIIAVSKPLPAASVVVLHGADGYTTNVTLERFAGDDCLIAHSHDGVPLSRDHGGPVRAILPRWYFWKSAKWLTRIEFLAVDNPGFWEVRGYHNDGDPWTEERYS